MFLDFGWSEMLLIGIVALIFIGPKDLPKALRVAGFWVRKARTLSREFQSSIDQMIREAELDDIRKDLKKASEIDFDQEFRQTIDPTGSLAEGLRPPELPNLSEPSRPVMSPADGAPQAAARTAAETAPCDIATVEPEESQIAVSEPEPRPAMVIPRDESAYEIMPPKP